MPVLHYILCQSSQETDFINGPLYKEVEKKFVGSVHPYYYDAPIKRKLTGYERIKLITSAMFHSREGDCFLLWGGGSMYLFILTYILFRKRKVMFMNLIFDPECVNRTMKTRLVYSIYKLAFRSSNYWANVNAEGLSVMYANVFNCSTDRFPVVFDSMSVTDELMAIAKQKKGRTYVFCGGRAKRDVACFVRIVKQMPETSFVCVFGKSMVTEEMKYLKNLEIHTDISLDEFNELLAKSTLCCIPLKSSAPCGLLVMQRAALLGIPIVSTETYSMRTIVPNNNYGYLCQRGDDRTMANCIRELLSNKKLYESIAHKALENMEKFTKPSVGKQIGGAVNEMYCESGVKTLLGL